MEQIFIEQFPHAATYICYAMIGIFISGMAVSVIVQGVKDIPCFKKIPTAFLVLILSIATSLFILFAGSSIAGFCIRWYFVVAAIIAGFAIRMIAIKEWEYFVPLIRRFWNWVTKSS